MGNQLIFGIARSSEKNVGWGGGQKSLFRRYYFISFEWKTTEINRFNRNYMYYLGFVQVMNKITEMYDF